MSLIQGVIVDGSATSAAPLRFNAS